MEDVPKNVEEYNPEKKRKILIMFDDMIADLTDKKKLNPAVTELFIRGRKLNISIVFIIQSYFKVTKEVVLSTTHFFIMKIPNKRWLQQIALNHYQILNLKTSWRFIKNVLQSHIFFLVNDAILPSDNPLTFRKNLLKINI